MKFMLDTNTCIFLIKQKSQKVLHHFKSCSVGDIGISAVSLAELEYGVEKSQHIQKNKIALNEFLLPLEIAPFDDNAAEIYGAVRSGLEKDGMPIGSMDMLIGAHALSLGVTLVTNNIKEFERIKTLKVVDWTK
ncbi:MAG TPA: VapC toxin family PIN domain ribonuclease [Nitrospiraceae bacterium]|nr:VapC toxin family PIN domain ribonuclease [Nitrospiraceae bacterium]